MAFLIIVVFLCIQALLANFMKEVAYAKGYDDNAHAFAMCFWLGIYGCLYVIALPDLKAQKAQEEIAEVLKIAYGKELHANKEQFEAQQLEAERLAKEKEAEELRRQEAEKKAYEESVSAYWAEHVEEKEALLKKKELAAEKINELGDFATKEREELQRLIVAIEEELTKDRRG